MTQLIRERGKIIFWVLAAIVIFALLASLGWQLFYGLVVPKSIQAISFPLPGLLAFSFVAGAVSFFSPCAFAVFPSYVGYFLATPKDASSKFSQGIKFASSASLGVFVFYLLLGLTLSIVGTQFTPWIRHTKWIIIPLIFLLGLVLLLGKHLPARLFGRVSSWFQIKTSSSGKTSRGAFFYGLVYAIGGAGCFLPILLVLALTPFLAGQLLAGITSFVVFAFALSLVLTLATVIIARGQTTLLQKISGRTELINKLAGLLLIATSVYLVFFFLITGM